MERHKIPADNQCLFTSVGYLLSDPPLRMDQAYGYRRLVADYIVNVNRPGSQTPLSPGGGGGGGGGGPSLRFDAATLGQSPQAYADGILHPDAWGGGIECAVFARVFGIEVAVVDIRTGQVCVFGEMEGHATRIYLLYDGSHYDALVWRTGSSGSGGSGGGGAQFRTVFPRDDAAALAGSLSIAQELKQQRQFVSTTDFRLVCQVCDALAIGEKGAKEHALATGHDRFSEYNG
jgi:ubiquitin thioesterase OTU1